MPTTDDCLSCKQSQQSLEETWNAEVQKFRDLIDEHFDFLDSAQTDLLRYCNRGCPLNHNMCRTCGVAGVIDEIEEALKARL